MSSQNYKKAEEYFNRQPGYVLHHTDPTLKYTDPERYEQWRIEDLVCITVSEHMKIHQEGVNNNMYGKGYKISGEKNGMYGTHRTGELNPNYGHHMSEESKKKSSESHKGQVAWNKGKSNCYSEESLKKMSDARKGKEPWNKGLKYKIVDGKSVLV